MRIFIALVEVALLLFFFVIVARDTVQIIGYIREELAEIKKEKQHKTKLQ